MSVTIEQTGGRIRTLLARHGRLSVDAGSIAPEADLYQQGMTSHASVNVMLALESEFGIAFPDEMLKRSVFASVASICGAVRALGGG